MPLATAGVQCMPQPQPGAQRSGRPQAGRRPAKPTIDRLHTSSRRTLGVLAQPVGRAAGAQLLPVAPARGGAMSSSAGPPEDDAEQPGPPEAAASAAAAAAAGPLPPAPPAAVAEEVEGDAVDADEQWFSGDEDDDDEEEFDGWLDHEMEDDEWEAMGELEDEDEEEEEDMMGELLADSGSSSDEDGEEGAEARVAAETSGRHVHAEWSAYAIPTASHHFQSADALSAVQLPASAGGGILAATFDVDGLAAWLLPAPGSLEKLGVNSQPAAQRLGGFQAPRDIYSMALSPCGRWIATGGEGGLLCIYSLDPSAPPRRPTAGRRPQLQGLNYLFTPVRLNAHVVGNAPQAMQSLAASIVATPAAYSQSATMQQVADRCSATGQLPHQQLLEQALSALFTHTMHGDIDDLAVEAALSTVREQLTGLQEASAALAAEVAELREQQAAGQDGVRERLAALQQRAADNGEALKSGQLRLQMLVHRLGSQAMRNTAALVGVETDVPGQPGAAAGEGSQAADAERGKQPATEAQQQQQPKQQGDVVPPAALVLRGIFSLGLEEANVQRVPFLSDGMTNGVRWGPVAGQMRLLAADQSQYVYIFERPQPGSAVDAASSSSASGSGSSGSGDLRPEQMLCSGLGGASAFWCMRPVNFFRAQQHAMGARVSQQFPPPDAAEQQAADAPAAAPGRSQRAAAAAASAAWAPLAKAAAGRSVGRGSPYTTAALGPFPVPCNLAAASPDGRWVAVVGDSQCVFLCDQAAGFSWRPLAYDLVGPRDNVEAGLEAGAQYLAWNASSTLLAVSSDALHAVFVFEPRSGRLVLRVEGHRRPCLCVAFAPWDDRLLVYTEESKHVHLRRVPREHEAAAAAGGRASGSSGGGDDGEGQQQGAAPAAAALFEQHARDDLADARRGYQLLRVPILPQEPGSQLPVGMSTRRRRINGMALATDGDLLLATKQGRVLRFLSSQPWSLQRHASWPPALKAAARMLLCCAHRQPPAGAGTGLWSLPLPLLQHIVELLAGSRTDWLDAGSQQGGMQQSPAGGDASGEAAAAAGHGRGGELQSVAGAASADFVG